MLTLIIGDSGSGKSEELAARINADIAKGDRAYLIVPEQQAVSSEIFMVDRLPDTAPLYFEVTNFTRLADTVFRMVGGLSQSTATREIEQLLMWRTLVETYPMLHNKPAKIDSATVGAMRGAVRDLRAMRLGAPLLHATAAKMENKALKEKLEDYALISTIYHDLLSESYSDASDRLDRLADLLMKHKPLAGAHIYVDGFSSFTEQEYVILGALLDASPMTVTLAMPPEADRQLCTAEVLNTLGRLHQLAKDRSLRVKTERKETLTRATDPLLRYVASHMYRVDYAACPRYTGNHGEALTLVEAPDPMEASQFVAADIRRRVAQGAHYNDFTIIASSLGAYEGILDTALSGADIPYFYSSHTELLSLEPIKMLFCAYAVITNGWRREDVIGYLKCGLCGVDATVADEFEAYCELWDIKGGRFTSEDPWMRSPDGLGEPNAKRAAYNEERLARINQARETFVPPLAALGETAMAPISVNEHIRALTEFLLKLDFPAKIEAQSLHWLALGDTRKGEEWERLWDLLCDALDSLSDILGDTLLSAHDFSSVLKLLFEEADMGHIPAALDEVTVGEAALIRSEGKAYVYLLGVNEDEFPAAVKEGGTFTEQERLLLQDSGLSLSDSLDTRSSRELFAFYRALTLAERGVTLIWNRLSPAFSETTPSDAVLRIRSLLPEDYPVYILGESNLIDRLYTPSMAYSHLGRVWGTEVGAAIQESLREESDYTARVEATKLPLKNTDCTLTRENAASVVGDRMSLSKSRVEQYAKCPLSYYCKYILKIDEDEKAQMSAADIGTFIHAVLESFLLWCKESKTDFRTMDDASRKTEITRIANEVLAVTMPPETRAEAHNQHLFDHLVDAAYLVACALGREFSDSDFAPALFEVNITDSDPACPAPYSFETPSGRTIDISGVIDRVDTYTDGKDTYVRVVDYKTGTMEFDLNKLDKGLDLQLFLYLISIWKTKSPAFRERLGVPEAGEIIPAGMMYFSSLLHIPTIDEAVANAGALDAALTEMEKSGLFLNDEGILTHMDKTEGHKHLRLGRQGGNYTAKALRSLKTLEELGELIDRVGAVMSRIGGDMESGLMHATPLKEQKGKTKTCEYCPYKVICRNPKLD